MSDITAVIAMSGAGKSRMGDAYEVAGWNRYDSDRRIAERLSSKYNLASHNNEVSTRGMAEWLGFPYEPQYPAHSVEYMYEEELSLGYFRRLIENAEKGSKHFIDLTGSAVYCSSQILEWLVEKTDIVFIDTDTPKERARLHRKFFNKPKPIIWADNYQPLPDENPFDAMDRCFDFLLDDRRDRGREIARDGITITRDEIDTFLIENIDIKSSATKR